MMSLEAYIGRCLVSIVLVLCVFVCLTSALSEDDVGELEAKRGFSLECQCCMHSYDRSCCEKCLDSKSSSMTPYFAKRSEPQYIESRVRRFTGCGCCYMSRFSNGFCCNVCNTAAKRWGKRSGGPGYDLPEIQDDLNVNSSPSRSPDCYCCSVFRNKNCCERCMDDVFV